MNGHDPLAHAPVARTAILVPRGWRHAVTGVIPDALVVEGGLGDAAGDTPGIVAAWPEEIAPPGYENTGPWLIDRVWIAWRTDAGPAVEDVDVTDPWTFLPLVNAEDGPGRIAASPALVARLGLPALPLPDSGSPAAQPSPAAALDLVLRRIHADEPAAALASGACEAAWLDGPGRARWLMSGSRLLDRVLLHPVRGTERPLELFVAHGDRGAASAARILRAGAPLLQGLGYEPAR